MSWRRARLGFFGRRLVGLMLDGSHHGKCEHDERDVTMPAMPRSGFVVVEPELVLGMLSDIVAHHIAQSIGVPLITAQKRLLPPWPRIARRLRPHPSGFATLVAKQTVHE